MRRGALTAAIAVLAGLLVPSVADTRPKAAGVFDVSGAPGQITKGPGGNMWVLLSGSSEDNTLARIKPSGNVTEYEPAALVNPVGLTLGPDGNLWATRNGGVVRIPPANPDNAQDFDIDAISDPRRIVPGPQGKLWTASGDQLASFKPQNPAGFDARTIDGMGARGIASSGGFLWIADFANARIIRAEPGSGGGRKIKVGGGPQEVAAGPKGKVAYTNQGTDPHTVGRIPGVKARKTKVPDTDPFGIDFAGDGKWWIANFASHDLSILSRDGNVKRFRKLPDNSGPRWVAAGAKGTVWVSLETSQQIARIKGVQR